MRVDGGTRNGNHDNSADFWSQSHAPFGGAAGVFGTATSVETTTFYHELPPGVVQVSVPVQLAAAADTSPVPLAVMIVSRAVTALRSKQSLRMQSTHAVLAVPSIRTRTNVVYSVHSDASRT